SALLSGICLQRLEKCLKDGIGAIKEMHKKDFCSLTRRTQLSLGEEKNLPTDIRLEEFHNGSPDLGLLELWFYLGRYLLISSSREGSMEANLQGIWNGDMRPAWSGNYTTNINVQMNYWLAEPGNLSQCHMPLLELIKGCVESGRETAKEQFGCRGWVTNHNIDLWKQTSPVGMYAQRPPVKYAYFPAASGWLCRHIWEHYRFTLDKSFLKDWYPVMREAALFYLDYLIEKDGYYLTAPSTSPENLFYDEAGRECAVSAGTTIDTAIIRTLFKDCIEAAGVLDMDKDLAEKLAYVSGKMLPYQTGKNGALREWCTDFPEVYKDHRHISHLYGLYPAEEIDAEKNPDLAAARKKTLDRRTDEGPGWSKAW
ncbi:MAG: glycoside hydrolase family 95 protein, partial [Lachnospiraceae bacterium]|nr:glycoside hydrolase family 95 protein [Lachnospiraceae bacterium]